MLRKFLLAIFFVMLFAPALQMGFSIFDEKPIQENRVLTEKPEKVSLDDLVDGPKKYLAWFDDHFGFRSLLIRMKYQLDYTLFNASNRIHIGKDGWLFYRSVLDVEKPAVNDYLEKNSWEVVAGVKNLAESLKRKNIQLVVFIAPMKDVFYYENLPKTVDPNRNSSQILILEDQLKNIANLYFLDARAILTETLKERDVFHKTDFHWNDPAAFSVAQSLVNHLGKLEGHSNEIWNTHPKIIYQESTGGEANFLPLLSPLKEQGLYLDNSTLPPHTISRMDLPLDVFTLETPTGTSLKPIVMIGDSFLDGMIRAGLQAHFTKSYKAQWNALSLEKLVNNLPADTKYLFIEFIEVSGSVFTQLANQK